jgi:hypothetical protein
MAQDGGIRTGIVLKLRTANRDPHRCAHCNHWFEREATARKHESVCNVAIHRLTTKSINHRRCHSSPEVIPLVPEAPVPDTVQVQGDPVPSTSEQVEASPDKNGFNFSFEICKILVLANQRRGLSEKDIQSILDCLKKAQELGHDAVLEFQTLAEFKVHCTLNSITFL